MTHCIVRASAAIGAIGLAFAAGPALAQAQRFQNTAILDQAVAQFTGKALGEEGGAISVVDTRLRLANCALPQVEWRDGGNQDAVVVRCMSPVWRIFVPVRSAPRAAAPPATTTVAAAGRPAPAPAAVRAEPVIRRGDPVTVSAGDAGFSITRDGIAMGDAAPGARFLVRIDDRRPPIQAVAIEAGKATLPGWAE